MWRMGDMTEKVSKEHVGKDRYCTGRGHQCEPEERRCSWLHPAGELVGRSSMAESTCSALIL